MRFLLLACCVLFGHAELYSQQFPHPQAHAHNDYEHQRPLYDALQNGFTSVEADVHLQDGRLLVSHDRPGNNAPTLERLYLAPLDSLLKVNNGNIYKGYEKLFYLMIDCKTEGETYEVIRTAVARHPGLICSPTHCPVRIYLSGNRPLSRMLRDGYSGLGIDGRPEDVGKGYSSEIMPVISDHYGNWSKWKATGPALPEELGKIKDLATRVHAEGKKLRLWAIPDNEVAWKALLDAGVDFINTDRLPALNEYLAR
jgi:glycerophosphoryl diester phosphodiesterase